MIPSVVTRQVTKITLQKGTAFAFVYNFYEERPGNQAPAHFTVHALNFG